MYEYYEEYLKRHNDHGGYNEYNQTKVLSSLHLLFKCPPESFPENSCFRWGSWPDDDNPGWLSRPVDDEKCDIGLEFL